MMKGLKGSVEEEEERLEAIIERGTQQMVEG